MKIKKGFVVREMCGEYIVTAESLELVNFNKLISLNSSAVYLWNEVKGKEFDEQTLAALLVKKYRIDEKRALDDATALCKAWKDAGVLE